MLSIVIENMGSLCSKNRHYNEADNEENAQAAEIERRIEQETKAEKHIQKLLLLGVGESGKSTIFEQRYKHLGQFAPLGGEQTVAQLPVLPGDGVSIGYSS